MELSPKFTDAFNFVAELHKDQTRKGTAVPYLAHLMSVAALVLEHEGSEDQAIAALLHDAVEDQGQGFSGGVAALKERIAGEWGTAVLAIVEACTDAETDPKPPWRERKEAYIQHLQTVPEAALLVSCADKLHNARAILRDFRAQGHDVWQRFTADRAGVLWYYRSLADAFVALPATPRPLAAELDRVVDELIKEAAQYG